MEFFGMGPLEIVLILIVALIAIGPGKLPQFARNLNKVISTFRKAALDLTAEVTKELKDEEIAEKQPSRQKELGKDNTEKVAENEAKDNTR